MDMVPNTSSPKFAITTYLTTVPKTQPWSSLPPQSLTPHWPPSHNHITPLPPFHDHHASQLPSLPPPISTMINPIPGITMSPYCNETLTNTKTIKSKFFVQQPPNISSLYQYYNHKQAASIESTMNINSFNINTIINSSINWKEIIISLQSTKPNIYDWISKYQYSTLIFFAAGLDMLTFYLFIIFNVISLAWEKF